MSKLYITLLSSLLIFISGCYAHLKVSKTAYLTNGTKVVVAAEYTRYFNQKIDGFDASLEPNGVWHIRFDSQLSDTQIAFKLGQMSVSTGE